jgi:PAS domain S-box-containing protein
LEVPALVVLNEKSVIHVLHIDDDPSLQEITKLMLLDLDSSFQIDCACSVDEALEILSTRHYDVVVSDYEMPQKDGLQFLKELREQKNDVPFILFTGKGREEVVIKALNLGADGYINKQGNPETVYGELAHNIVQLLNQTRLKTELAESEVRFKQFFRNLPNAVAVYEAISNGEDFVFKDFNAAAEKIEKTRKADIIGKRVTEVFPGAKDFGILEIFNRVWKTGQSEYFSTALYQDKRDTGSWRENWIFKLPNENVVAVYNDVTERVKTDLELKRTNEVLERVGEGIDAGLAVIGKDYHVVWANKHLMDLGVAPNKKCYQTFNNLDTVCPDCGAKKVFEQNISLDVHEYKTKNSKGETVWVELRVTPLKDKNGNVTAALELAVPITERKYSEKTLKESEERSRAIVENSPIGIATANTDKHFLSANEAFCKIIGYSEEELLKLTFKDITYPADLKDSFIKMGELENNIVSSFSLEKRYVKKDGVVVNGRIMVSALRNQNGIPRLFIAELEDITELKKAEYAMRKSQNLLAESGRIGKVGGWQFNIDTHLQTWTDETYRIHEVDQNFMPTVENGISFYTPDSRIIIEQAVEQAIAHGKPFDVELQIITAKGNLRNVRAVGEPNLADRIVTGFFQDITERKQAEETLKKSEDRFRQLSENAEEWIWEVDSKGLYTYSSSIVEKLIGYTPEEIVGKKYFFDLFLDSEREILKKAAFDAFDSKSSFSGFLNRNLHKNGSVVWLSTSGVPILDEKGTLQGYRGLDIDITERQEMEKALKTSEENFRRQFEEALDPIFLADAQTGIIVNCNRAACKLVGRHKTELVGLHQRILHPQDEINGEFSLTFQRHLNEREGKVLEGKVITKTGEIKDVTISAKTLTIGNKTLLNASFHDITEYNKAVMVLKESEEKFRTLAEESPNMIFINHKGRVVYANKRCEEILKYSRADFYSPNFSFFSLISPEYLETLKSAFDKHMSGEEVPTYEYVLITRKGERINALITTKLIEYKSERAFLGIVTDITEHHKAQEALKTSLHEMEILTEKLRVVGGLTRHDVGNKLMVISSNVFLLKKQLGDNPKLTKYLESIDSSISQSERIFEFSRLYEKIGAERPKNVDVFEFFNVAAAMFSNLRTVKIVNECQGLQVVADSLLRQLFYNFIDNSLKHGEKVTQIRLHFNKNEYGVNLFYEDNGVGVSTCNKQKIFDKGFTTGKGSGLGLHLIKKMIEVYGWAIEENGEPGKGAKFTITIPKLNKQGRENYQPA